MSSAAGPGPAKAVAKVALLGVDAASAAILIDCFRQFGIEAGAIGDDESKSIGDTYHACVVPLAPGAEVLLRKIRQVSRRTVVYGTCGSVREALKFSQFGINALFQTPVNKHEALQVVRGTHLLVQKELRRYVRVPLLCSVTLETGTDMLEGSSMEISAGGMSLAVTGHLVVPQMVLAMFALPGVGATGVKSVVCWARQEDGMAAIRFDPADPRRDVVRRWIDEYLDA